MIGTPWPGSLTPTARKLFGGNSEVSRPEPVGFKDTPVYPEGFTKVVCFWASEGKLYHDLGAHVASRMVLGLIKAYLDHVLDLWWYRLSTAEFHEELAAPRVSSRGLDHEPAYPDILGSPTGTYTVVPYIPVLISSYSHHDHKSAVM